MILKAENLIKNYKQLPITKPTLKPIKTLSDIFAFTPGINPASKLVIIPNFFKENEDRFR